ncbi:prepilin-type N-terminal cleavage/methylation domain-containing protein [Comamonas sp.]|uniref:type IV pilin protein n=1 Tax=Comamonas sp. TaxID=34028 RepID=UPI00289AF574|nr:prepilin-type N-terminal cleavage/methylation domain-containing protein [Comamonas sp.]
MMVFQAAGQQLPAQPARRRAVRLAIAPARRGFTLIEVMIVVAIVAILASIAIPSYSEYIKRGHIVEGITPLADMGAKMEQHFQDRRKYDGACVDGSIAPEPAATARFRYDCDLAATTFTISAIGLGSMSGFVFTLDEKGQRLTTDTPSGWTKGTDCWSTNKAGRC